MNDFSYLKLGYDTPSFAGFANQHRASTWLNDEAIPFWGRAGLDKTYGGFIESMDLSGAPSGAGFKRTRVTARQIYVFCQSGFLGIPSAFEIAEHGVQFLLRHHKSETKGAWYRSVTADGKPLDQTDDLYDLAFVLFALAWWHRVSGDHRIVEMAKDTLDHIHDALKHPSGAGFIHAADGHSHFQQNPHMHLLEALVELFESTRDERFLDEATCIYQLFKAHFLVDGSLREYFGPAWSQASGIDGRKVEPGHMSEWAWLLARYGRVAQIDVSGIVIELMKFVRQSKQLNAKGLLMDIVLDDGQPFKTDTRLWPQTEMLKGLIALSELTGENVNEELEECMDAIFENFIYPAPQGCWIDHRSSDGKVIVDKIPASSLYHIMLGFCEYRRAALGN